MVALSAGVALDDGLTDRIRTALRTGISPRHVPDQIISVPSVLRTISGKTVEVPVKRVLAGADPAAVVTKDALADPAAWAGLVDAVRGDGMVREAR